MKTIVKVIKDASPRKPLCDRLGISVQYASDIANGEAVGATRKLAVIAAELNLSDDEIGASVREMFPSVFAAARRRHAAQARRRSVAASTSDAAA